MNLLTPTHQWVEQPHLLKTNVSKDFEQWLLNPDLTTTQSQQKHKKTSSITSYQLQLHLTPDDIKQFLDIPYTWQRKVSLTLNGITWCHAISYLAPEINNQVMDNELIGHFLKMHQYQRSNVCFSLNHQNNILRQTIWSGDHLIPIPIYECFTEEFNKL
ncbi:MAG: hypothetical protein ACON5A_00845 [Candidatus Comchoanobacterales bacterium]